MLSAAIVGLRNQIRACLQKTRRDFGYSDYRTVLYEECYHSLTELLPKAENPNVDRKEIYAVIATVLIRAEEAGIFADNEQDKNMQSIDTVGGGHSKKNAAIKENRAT